MWLIGFFTLCIGCLVHASVLPYADFTMLTANTATAIIFGALFSICCLDEVFIPAYDMPAYVLMIMGSVLTIIQSDTTEKSYTSAEVAEMLGSTKAIVYFMSAWTLHFTTLFVVLWMLRCVSDFETDCEEWLRESP